MKNPQMTAGPQNPHKTVEVGEKCVKALWGKALKPIKFRISEHIFFPKSSNEKKSHRVEEIPILGPVIARLPGHSIACSLLPLAVLKLPENIGRSLQLHCMQPITACGIETTGREVGQVEAMQIACSLLPLAVLKLLLGVPINVDTM